MPSRKVHEQLDRILFGRKHTAVHKLLDLPSVWLGERHRVVLHDELSAMLAGFLVDGSEGAMSALLHVWLDKNSNRWLKK
jgi:hypothetical protein